MSDITSFIKAGSHDIPENVMYVTTVLGTIHRHNQIVTIMDNFFFFFEFHGPCALKTAFIDFVEIKQTHCSCYSRLCIFVPTQTPKLFISSLPKDYLFSPYPKTIYFVPTQRLFISSLPNPCFYSGSQKLSQLSHYSLIYYIFI
jgi:hypothetical protein